VACVSVNRAGSNMFSIKCCKNGAPCCAPSGKDWLFFSFFSWMNKETRRRRPTLIDPPGLKYDMNSLRGGRIRRRGRIWFMAIEEMFHLSHKPSCHSQKVHCAECWSSRARCPARPPRGSAFFNGAHLSGMFVTIEMANLIIFIIYTSLYELMKKRFVNVFNLDSIHYTWLLYILLCN